MESWRVSKNDKESVDRKVFSEMPAVGFTAQIEAATKFHQAWKSSLAS